MSTLFFLRESMEVSNIPIAEFITLLETECIEAQIETYYNYSIILDYDIPDGKLKNIVEKSGYIHSAGPLVFNKRWNKCSYIDVAQKIHDYLIRNKIHLGYSTFEKPKDSKSAKAWEEHNKSILDAQIRTDKAFLGRMSYKRMMTLVYNSIKDIFHAEWKNIDLFQKEKGRLFIYKDYCDKIENGDDDFILKYPGCELNTHLICYHSKARNLDPVLHFGEKKPYWAGIFTTPQPLMTAMVNLSTPKPGQKILEPFSHMAGVPLQAIRLGIECTAIDIEHAEGGKDNVDFFLKSPNDVEIIINEMEDIINFLRDESPEEKDKSKYFEIISNDAKNAVSDPRGEDQYPKMTWFSDNPLYDKLSCRLLFYILRRYYYELIVGLKDQASCTALQYVNDEIELIKNAYLSDLTLVGNFEPDSNVLQCATLGCDNDLTKLSEFVTGDIIELMPKMEDESFDAIITDPPYGAGIDEGDQDTLIGLYDVFLKESFRVLKHNGKLIFCSLWKSKTGKMIAKDLRTEGVIEQIKIILKDNHLKIRPLISSDKYCDETKFTYKINDTNALNLFYWKSKTFLDRGIIAFTIDKN